jgi:hypothetical protein
LQDKKNKDLEYFLERCSEERAAAEDRLALLESYHAAVLETNADLRAKITSLRDTDDEIRLELNATRADLGAKNLSLCKLSEKYEFLECRLKEYELHEAPLHVITTSLQFLPAYNQLDQGMVTATTHADASDVVMTPANQRTLEEELDDLAMFDDCVSGGTTFYGDDVLEGSDDFSDFEASRRGLYPQDELQREEGFPYMDRAFDSSFELNEKDTTPFSEVDKVRAVDMAREP